MLGLENSPHKYKDVFPRKIILIYTKMNVKAENKFAIKELSTASETIENLY